MVLVIPAALALGEEAKVTRLLIGTSGTLSPDGGSAKEKANLETMQSFIKEETGLDATIVRQKNWRVLADKMAKGKLHLGVFQGYEFAWAQANDPKLEPLALANSGQLYPVVFVVVPRESRAKIFSQLKGQSFSLPAIGPESLFVERQCQAEGKKPEEFFSKVLPQKNIEDTLDDVVDGVVQGTAVQRAALEGYKRRKPARFNRLKEIARSQPFPPAVIASYGKVLPEETVRRFRKGLLDAGRKERGKMMLTLFRLTGFESVPADFKKVMAQTRKTYPPPAS
jgi:ABC-type phosphate/phosphonate transport system substrate-binding protein